MITHLQAEVQVPELLPCPFCGCSIAIFIPCENPALPYGVHPDTPCFCRNYKIAKFMFDAWNRRANDSEKG